MVDETNSDAGRVRLKGRLVCESAREAEIVRAHLAEHIRLTRSEAGCLYFDVVQRDDPLIWHVDECFRDEEASHFISVERVNPPGGRRRWKLRGSTKLGASSDPEGRPPRVSTLVEPLPLNAVFAPAVTPRFTGAMAPA